MRRLVFNQSSPVHPVSESRGGPLSVTKDKGRTEILVSNFGYFVKSYKYAGEELSSLCSKLRIFSDIQSAPAGLGLYCGHQWQTHRDSGSTACQSIFCLSVFCQSTDCLSVFCQSTVCLSVFCPSTVCLSVYCQSTVCLSVFCQSTVCLSVYCLSECGLDRVSQCSRMIKGGGVAVCKGR